jgi:hypothetical protein
VGRTQTEARCSASPVTSNLSSMFLDALVEGWDGTLCDSVELVTTRSRAHVVRARATLANIGCFGSRAISAGGGPDQRGPHPFAISKPPFWRLEPKVRIELTAYALPRQAPRRRPILNSPEDPLTRFGQRLRVERNLWSTVDKSRVLYGAHRQGVNRCRRGQCSPRPALAAARYQLPSRRSTASFPPRRACFGAECGNDRRTLSHPGR